MNQIKINKPNELNAHVISLTSSMEKVDITRYHGYSDIRVKSTAVISIFKISILESNLLKLAYIERRYFYWQHTGVAFYCHDIVHTYHTTKDLHSSTTLPVQIYMGLL